MEIFDYRSETFSPAPCSQLLCSICLCVFYNPVKCPCQHVFCKNCIERWLQNNGTCPKCRLPVHVSSLIKAPCLIRTIILNLKIQCKHHSRGCEETFPVEHYKAHLKTCPYMIIKCSNGNCKHEFFLKDKEKHHCEECLFYWVTCTVCQRPVAHHKLLDHDCFRELTTEFDSLRQRVTELEEENGLLRCQISNVDKKFAVMHEAITVALHGLRDSEQKCSNYEEEHTVICNLQKEVEMLRNLVEAVQKPSEQNGGISNELKNCQHIVVPSSQERKELLYIFVALIFFAFIMSTVYDTIWIFRCILY